MISILPSPCWLILMVSPRLPTRPSTLIFSFRNFSKAETSKILSLAGWEALMMNCTHWIVRRHRPSLLGVALGK